jgi:hypothetical protein
MAYGFCAEYSDGEDANADNEPELINLDEIADKITEFGEGASPISFYCHFLYMRALFLTESVIFPSPAARQKFKFLASKVQSLIGDNTANKGPNASPNVEYKYAYSTRRATEKHSSFCWLTRCDEFYSSLIRSVASEPQDLKQKAAAIDSDDDDEPTLSTFGGVVFCIPPNAQPTDETLSCLFLVSSS